MELNKFLASTTRWLELATQFDGENLLPIEGELISNNGISIVIRGDDGIYKRSIPFLIENELWCLNELSTYGFVPMVNRYDKYTLLIEDLGASQPISDDTKLWDDFQLIASVLKDMRIRHGDITTQAVIVRDNAPHLIDFAESRRMDDPRPDKRVEGDDFWIKKTYAELTQGKVSE